MCAQALGACTRVGMPEASRVPVRRVTTVGRATVRTGMLVGLGAHGARAVGAQVVSGMGAFQWAATAEAARTLTSAPTSF
ncbi:hypothetical protein GCM10010344_36690 [Streptomyces bluensis]|nr:hypothetical protein GCM10010344_36690 [Streptomyces bluensis]